MIEQPSLFPGMFASCRAVQADLFAEAPPETHQFNRCPDCGAALEKTVSGYWTCPRGHTRLQEG